MDPLICHISEVLELFGKNVDTVNGEDWARHRKLTAPCFNERVSSFAWDESLRQATSMLSGWLGEPQGKVATMVDDTRIVALHVISAAGFGVSHDFHGGARILTKGHTLSYVDALMVVLDLIPSIIVDKMPWLKSIPDFALPKKVKTILEGTREFRMYMDEMLAGERKIMAENPGTAKPNLVSTLIRTSDESKAGGDKSSVRLTDDEIKGNMFIFNIAGHDTTANTLAYAVALIAVHPEVQEWVLEEVKSVFKENGEGRLVYEELFPKLKRCLAVMVSHFSSLDYH
jgi:cytochrome P450